MQTSYLSQSVITNVINDNIRTGNIIIDTILLMVLMSLITLISANIKEMGIKIIEKIQIYIERYRNKYNILVIRSIYDEGINQRMTCSNKLLINAILQKDTNGKNYEIYNDSYTEKYGSLYETEMNRKLSAQINEIFEIEGIIIERIIIKKKETKENQKIETEKIQEEKIILKSYKSIEEMKEFIKGVRDEYIEKKYSKTNKLYTYSPIIERNKSTDETTYISFYKTEYKSDKTFENLFIPNKKRIYEYIENFKNKRGIYEKRGTYHKLGILLHGIPGTGKTSIIKAVANILQRHIILIKLTPKLKIEQLLGIFRNDYIYNRNRGINDFIPLNKRLYIFEEIDTAGPIVMDREIMKNMKKNKKKQYKKYFKMKDKTPKSDNKSESSEDSEDEIDNYMDTCNINLGDLLMILDGVCEIDGFAYIMTTNRKHMLDKALIRPGRITLDIELKEMESEEIYEMLCYHYMNDENNDINKGMIIDLSKELNGKLTPAKLEVECNSNTIKEIYDKYIRDNYQKIDI